jgi:glycine cleavage system H protein
MDVLTFAMGEFVAEFPKDRHYVKNHMWALPQPNGSIRYGFTAYAVRLLQDVYFIDFDCAVGAHLNHRQEFGSIESKKAESGMYSPTTGQVTAINELLLDDPSVINVDKYGAGWLLEMSGSQEHLLAPDAYIEHLKSAWDVAQRTIKGQANTDTTDEE